MEERKRFTHAHTSLVLFCTVFACLFSFCSSSRGGGWRAEGNICMSVPDTEKRKEGDNKKQILAHTHTHTNTLTYTYIHTDSFSL